MAQNYPQMCSRQFKQNVISLLAIAENHIHANAPL